MRHEFNYFQNIFNKQIFNKPTYIVQYYTNKLEKNPAKAEN